MRNMGTIALLGLWLLLPGLVFGGEDTKPLNVVFFLVDDLGWADVACFGSTFYETPNIDRLAAEYQVTLDPKKHHNALRAELRALAKQHGSLAD